MIYTESGIYELIRESDGKIFEVYLSQRYANKMFEIYPQLGFKAIRIKGSHFNVR